MDGGEDGVKSEDLWSRDEGKRQRATLLGKEVSEVLPDEEK